eukprot:307960_1
MNQISNTKATVNAVNMCNRPLMNAISESKPALQLVTSDSKQETGTAEYTTEGNGDGDNVNIAPDEFVIDGDDEIHDICDDKGIDNEEDTKDNKMTEQGMEAVMDDIAKNEKEPGQENSNSSGSFD